MPTRDGDDEMVKRLPIGAGVRRTPPNRPVDVSVAIERVTAEIRHMASAIREMGEDLQRGQAEVSARLVESRDRLEQLERSESASRAAAQGQMDAMTSTMQSSLTGLTDTLTSFTAVSREKEEILMEQIREDRLRSREREDREEARKAELHALTLKREEERLAEARAAKARKDQWMLRAWERFRQPMLMIAMAGAGLIIATLGRCGGG